MIQCKDLSFQYQENSRKLLNLANLTIQENGIYGLIGPNGAGKTTFFDLLMNQWQPTSGQLILSSTEANRVLMPQTISAPDVLLCKEVRDFILALNSEDLSDSQKRFDDSLSSQELRRYDEIKNRRFGKCSGGERAWLMCNLTLSLRRDLYLLDEPTVGIDPEFRILIWKKMAQRAAEGKIIIVSSHSLEEIGDNVKQLILLIGGKFHVFRDIDEFKNKFGGKNADDAFQKAISESES